MSLSTKEVPCNIHFLNEKTKETLVLNAKLDIYSGVIKCNFTGIQPQIIQFEFENNKYEYEVFTLGGKYFISNYSNSPLMRAVNLDKKLRKVETSNLKKLKL